MPEPFATIASLMAEVKTILRGDARELACQGCGYELPAERARVIVLDGLPYCSDECSEKHEPPTEEEPT
jgi:hypothetical protein